jgi:hypothetical protein
MDRWDKSVINAFINHLAANGHDGLTVDTWPDEEERNASAIDAMAGSFAIEHTSIDTLDGQREADVPFKQSIGCLDKQLQVPFYLGIFVKWGAITKGQNYSATCEAVKRWILEDSPQLPCGQHNVEDVSGVPFALIVWKREDMEHGVFVGLSAPLDETFGERLKKGIERKAKKLTTWSNHTRVLLIESDDIALMNHVVFWKALKQAYPDCLPRGVDQIWYADTSGKWRSSPPRFMKMTNDFGVLSERELP